MDKNLKRWDLKCVRPPTLSLRGDHLLLIQDSEGSAETDDPSHQPNENGTIKLATFQRRGLKLIHSLLSRHFTDFQNINQKLSRIKFVCITPEVYVQCG